MRNKNLTFILQQYKKKERYAILRGGTSSGKTYSALNALIFFSILQQDKIVSIVSATVPHLKRGAQRDFENLLTKLNLRSFFDENKTDRIYINKYTNTKIEFFSADNSAKLRGARRDFLFINEVNLIDESAFDELDARTREFVILDFNPVAKFWIIDKMLKMGYEFEKIECVSTYKDNIYLSPGEIQAIEQRKEIADWWKVYGEGLWGANVGEVLYNFEISTVRQPYTHFDVIGVDFGEGRSPSAVVGIKKIDGNTIYAMELAYGNYSLANLVDILSSYRAEKIVGDSAQIEMINGLRRYNINIFPCYKMNLVASFNLINNVHLILEGDNLIKEAQQLQWSDRGKGLIKIGCSDHAIDAMRYAIHEIL
jgi:phage terminase large subunit